MYLNNATIGGNVGGDGILRDAGQTKVLSFSLASTSPFGEKTTTWFNVSLFGRQAETLAPYIKKGAQVAVIGSVENRPYMKDGEKRFSLDLRANSVQLIGGRREEGDTSTDSDVSDDDLF